MTAELRNATKASRGAEDTRYGMGNKPYAAIRLASRRFGACSYRIQADGSIDRDASPGITHVGAFAAGCVVRDVMAGRYFIL